MTNEIELETPAPEARSGELHERLAESGQALRKDEFQTFLLSVRDEDGSLVAGCKGEIAFRSAHVSELWVDDRHRGRGLGQRLLERAAAHAARAGCTRIHLETRNERARALYERLGYTVFGSLPDYADGNALSFLTMNLDQGPAIG